MKSNKYINDEMEKQLKKFADDNGLAYEDIYGSIVTLADFLASAIVGLLKSIEFRQLLSSFLQGS